MSLFKLLKADHEIIEDLFDDLQDNLANPKEKKALFEKLCKEMKAHNEAEEGVFYKALSAVEDERILALQSLEEHHLAEKLTQDLQDEKLGEEEWEAKFNVLKKVVLDHIENEEDEIFDEAEDAFEKEELEAMAVQFKEMKTQ